MNTAIVHAVIGVASLVAFLATGAYMETALHHLAGMPDGPRLLYRSAHGYLLMAACLNLLLAAYWRDAARRGACWLQYLGSAALWAAPPLLLAAFAIEPALGNLDRRYARAALYLVLAGSLLHAMAALVRPARSDHHAVAEPPAAAVAPVRIVRGLDLLAGSLLALLGLYHVVVGGSDLVQWLQSARPAPPVLQAAEITLGFALGGMLATALGIFIAAAGRRAGNIHQAYWAAVLIALGLVSALVFRAPHESQATVAIGALLWLRCHLQRQRPAR